MGGFVTDPVRFESLSDRAALLAHARNVAERWLAGDVRSSATARPRVAGDFGGAFVTLWSGKRLRGCVGTFAHTSDLAATIERVTVSTLKDSRFASCPVTVGELAKLTFEISVLSDPALTHDPLSLTPGVHGIVIRSGERSGCFLPKVALERGWSASQFLSNCCSMKAGLPEDGWREEGVEVSLFTADSFREAELPGTPG